MTSIKVKQLNAEVAELEQEMKALEKKRDELLGRTLVQCINSRYGKGCGKKHRICNLVYIRTHWYVQPYGCTGGDYWNEGEGNFICPACQHRNTLVDWHGRDPVIGREKLSGLKYQFKSIVDEHERDY
jgi:hypothetical protein